MPDDSMQDDKVCKHGKVGGYDMSGWDDNKSFGEVVVDMFCFVLFFFKMHQTIVINNNASLNASK